MKRLLVLMIVFAMTSAASAAFMDIRVNGNPLTGNEVGASDIITIVLVDDVDATERTLVGALNTSSINASLGDNASHAFFAPPSIGGWTITPAGAGYTSLGSGTWFGGTLPADDKVFVHEFHVPDSAQFSDEILVDWNIAYQFVDQSGVGELVLHVTPEPMTIGLLGLGALGLLRRRK